LIDLYYLKERQLRKGRIVFERTKILERIDLKLHPKAIGVIDRNKVNGRVVVSVGKDKKQYEVFRRTYQRALIFIENYSLKCSLMVDIAVKWLVIVLQTVRRI
jgi:hypothetical protein